MAPTAVPESARDEGVAAPKSHITKSLYMQHVQVPKDRRQRWPSNVGDVSEQPPLKAERGEACEESQANMNDQQTKQDEALESSKNEKEEIQRLIRCVFGAQVVDEASHEGKVYTVESISPWADGELSPEHESMPDSTEQLIDYAHDQYDRDPGRRWSTLSDDTDRWSKWTNAVVDPELGQ